MTPGFEKNAENLLESGSSIWRLLRLKNFFFISRYIKAPAPRITVTRKITSAVLFVTVTPKFFCTTSRAEAMKLFAKWINKEGNREFVRKST